MPLNVEMSSPSQGTYQEIEVKEDPADALRKVIKVNAQANYTCCCLFSWMTPKSETEKIQAFVKTVDDLMDERSTDEGQKVKGIVNEIYSKINAKEKGAYQKFLQAITETSEYKLCHSIKNGNKQVIRKPTYGLIDAI